MSEQAFNLWVWARESQLSINASGKWIFSEQETAGRGRAQRGEPPLHEMKLQEWGTRHFRALAFLRSSPMLMRLRAVNYFVAGPQSPDDCAAKILGLQSLSGPSYSRGRQYYGYLS